MSSFCWTVIRARWASNAVDSSESRLSTTSATRARWSPTSRKNGAASGCDAGLGAVGEPVHRLPQRQHRAAHLGDLALEHVDAGRVVGALVGEDRRLDLVDVGLELVGDLLVAVDDLVADGVHDRGRAVGEHVLAALEPAGARPELAALPVPDGDDEVRARRRC